MAKPYILADAVDSTLIDVPCSEINLPAWLWEMIDIEYQRCSNSHWAMGISRSSHTKPVSINVETVGGHLMIQHFVEDISQPDHLSLVSERSDLYIFHLIHTHMTVIWEMTVTQSERERALFTCRVIAESRSWFLKLLSWISLAPFFVKKHVEGETVTFAESIAGKFQSPNPN